MGPKMDPWERGNEFSGYIKGREIFTFDCLLQNTSATHPTWRVGKTVI